MTILRSGLLSLVSALSLLACGDGAFTEGASSDDDESLGEVSSALTTTAARSLFITMTSVTRDTARTSDPCSAVAGDENKVWTFGHLLKREAEKNSLNVNTYKTNWLNAWNSTASINGQTVPVVVAPAAIAAWDRFGGASRPPHKAPFYLLAIVNRLDLRSHRPLGEPLGGEIRFIFGVLDAPASGAIPCPTILANPNTTLIFEYSPAKANENEVRDLANRWYSLRTLSGSAYRNALQVLSEEVVNSGKLLRIRTNESTNGGEWTLTELEPNSSTKYLQRTTIKQSPTMALAGGSSNSLGQYIADNREALQANDLKLRGHNNDPIGSYLVPNQFSGTSTWFRGGFNVIPNGANFGTSFWNAPNVAALPAATWSNARHLFSLGTCNGCHGKETGTGFLHVIPPSPGAEASLSQFLQGTHTVSDPVTGTSRTFNIMARREEDLSWLATGGQVASPVFGNYYQMVFTTGGRCLDSEGNNNNENALVKAYGCHGNGNQRLVLVPQGTAATPTQGVRAMYNMKFKHSGKCLDVQNDSTSSGAKLVQRTCDGTSSQKVWLSGTNGPTFYRLFHFLHSDLCLMVENLSTADAAPVVQAACTYADAQGFKFVE